MASADINLWDVARGKQSHEEEFVFAGRSDSLIVDSH